MVKVWADTKNNKKEKKVIDGLVAQSISVDSPKLDNNIKKTQHNPSRTK